MSDFRDTSSTKPYLIRALYEWCTDNGHTPFIAVSVDETVRVPFEFVKDGEIVLNISLDATSSLQLGNDIIEFKGRFGGVARDIYVPVSRVLAIYARENGQGMSFPIPTVSVNAASVPPQSMVTKPNLLVSITTTPSEVVSPDMPRPTGGAKPSLKRIK
jgi:stringent starvation protein B